VEKPLLPKEQLESTWLWRVAFDSSLDEAMLGEAGARWLGFGSAAWPPPAISESSSSTPLSPVGFRARSEDAEAVEHLGQLYAAAACALGRSPNSYGSHVVVGYQIGLDACEQIGDKEGAKEARKNLTNFSTQATPLATPERSTGLPLNSPIELKIVVEGEGLSYSFFHPGEFSEFAALLRPSPGATGVPRGGVAGILGTSLWAGGDDLLLATGADLIASAGSDVDLAALEQGAEETLTILHHALKTHGPTAPEALGHSEVSLLMGWARRALYRDLGLEMIRQSRADIALPLLEEAAGSSGRLRPAPGRDPLLLAAVARARYENNQGLRTIDLLRTISEVEGWEASGVIADLVAREEVLPSSAGAKLRR